MVRYWCTPSLLGHAGTSRCHSGSSAGSPVSYQQPNLMHSVVVPTRNHPHSLSKTLESLASAEHPDGGWEVIVVDNSDEHEKDLTARVVAALHDSHFRYLPTSPRGLMAARHDGTACARGEIVSWIDDDEDVASSWFSGVQECVQAHGAMLVTGPFRPDYESPPPPWLDDLWDSSHYGRHLGLLTLCDFGRQVHEIPPLLVWGGNLSVSRRLFYEVRGSHPDYLETPFYDYQGDGECGLTRKIGALGLSAWYSPRCEVAHRVPTSRMTVEYLERRAFFQGLTESFAEYRREYGLEPSAGAERPGPSIRVILGSYIRSVARRVGLGGVRRGFVGAVASRDADQGSSGRETAEGVRHLILQESLRGYAHHRTALAASSALREWVLRPDFLGENGIPPSGDSVAVSSTRDGSISM